MADLIAPSGAIVTINAASFEEASLLHRAALREMVNAPDFGLRGVFFAAGSETMNALIWPCLARCLYNKEKIIPMTFNQVEARQDFYFVVKACIEANIGPLFESLRSAWNDYQTQAKPKEEKSQNPQ